MEISINNVNDTRKNLTVIVPSSIVDEEKSKLVAHYSSQASLPGFRKGKVPHNVILAKFNNEISEELKFKVASRALQESEKQHKLNIYSLVNFDTDSISPNQPVKVSLTIDIKPDVSIPDYSTLKIELKTPQVSDQDIQNTIDRIRSEQAQFILSQDPAQKGDFIKLSYSGSLNGQPLSEIYTKPSQYTSQNNTWEEVDSDNSESIPSLSQSLLGVKTGDKKSISVSYPAEFPQFPELAGKSISYDIEIKEVRKKALPELNQEFIKKLGVKDEDTLRSTIREQILSSKKRDNHVQIRNQIINFLQSSVTATIPESAIDDETDELLRFYMADMIRRGVSEKELKANEQELIAQARQASEQAVRTNLVLEAIGQKESIEISNQDLQLPFMQEAMMAGVKPEKFAKELQNDRHKLNRFRQKVLRNKILDFIEKQIKVQYID